MCKNELKGFRLLGILKYSANIPKKRLKACWKCRRSISDRKGKEIQTITEQNLHGIFKLEFVTSELQLPGFRIDTLAFNKESLAY